MITILSHREKHIANEIHAVFQASYKIEAQLIGVVDFPPLSRSAMDISKSSTKFLGYCEETKLAAVLEFELLESDVLESDVLVNVLDIHSLTVAPDHFRKGIANKLISYVLTTYDFDRAIVETAAANKPAIRLYEKQDFIAFKTWTPAHGIEKIALCYDASNRKTASFL